MATSRQIYLLLLKGPGFLTTGLGMKFISDKMGVSGAIR